VNRGVTGGEGRGVHMVEYSPIREEKIVAIMYVMAYGYEKKEIRTKGKLYPAPSQKPGYVTACELLAGCQSQHSRGFRNSNPKTV